MLERTGPIFGVLAIPDMSPFATRASGLAAPVNGLADKNKPGGCAADVAILRHPTNGPRSNARCGARFVGSIVTVFGSGE